MGSILLVNLAVVFSALTLLWVVSVLLHDASIIDPFWGLGFVIVAVATWLQADNHGPRSVLLLALVSLWGLRLFTYLSWRNWGHDEDYRYAEMRKFHGKRFWYRSLYRVFWLQAALLWFISFPVQYGIASVTQRLGALDWLGGLLCIVGVYFEAVGDYQLAKFRGDPNNAGKVWTMAFGDIQGIQITSETSAFGGGSTRSQRRVEPGAHWPAR